MIGGFQVGPFQPAYQQQGTPPVVTVTKGWIQGEKKRRKKEEESYQERIEARERLREAIHFAIDGPKEVKEVVLQYAEASKPLSASSVDYDSILEDAKSLRILMAYYKAEMQRIEDEEDEEFLLL